MDDSPASTPPNDGRSWGLLRAGGALLALQVEALQEVIACPPQLETLPADAPGICGAVRLRGQVVPVLCLRSALGLSPRAARAGQASNGTPLTAVILLMRHQSRLLGLLADAVQGMARVPTAALQTLHTASGNGGIATHVFEVGEQVATVLEPARIAALPGVPMVQALPPAASALASAHGEALLQFRCAGVPLALAAAAVDSTVPETDLHDSPLRRGPCLGVFQHHGQEMAALDLAALLGIAPPGMPSGRHEPQCMATPQPRSAMLVLRTPKGLVGLTMDHVSDIVRVAPAAVQQLPTLGLAQRHLYRGLIAPPPADATADVSTPGAGTPHLLLDDSALASHGLVLALSSLARPSISTAATAGGDSTATKATGRTVLTYKAGVETASPLIQVREIIPVPASLVSAPDPQTHTLGVFTHRGVTLPLLDLVSLLQGNERAAGDADVLAQRVLIVEDGPHCVGLRVDGLGAIETAGWEGISPRGGSEDSLDARQFAKRSPMVELGVAHTRRTLACLDLQQLVRSLHSTQPA